MTASTATRSGPSSTSREEELGRRRVLAGLLALAWGCLGVALIGPIGSLDSRPAAIASARRGDPASASPRPTAHRCGPASSASTSSSRSSPTRIGVDDSQVVLLRVPPDVLTQRTVDGGAVDGWVAYSKICTHAGCSVGLFGVDNRPPDTLRQLVCPCHQSVFDPVDAARARGRPGDPPAAAARPRRRRRGLPRRARPTSTGRRRPDRLERSMSDDRARRRRPTTAPERAAATHAGPASAVVERYVDSVTGRVGAELVDGKVLRKVFPNHFSFLWGEVALYSFMVLLITGDLPDVLLRGLAAAARLRRLVPAAAGRRGVGRLRLGDADLLRRQGRPADPPDAPLGGARVRRRDRPAHGPGVLHRRLPPAPRDQLGRRR